MNQTPQPSGLTLGHGAAVGNPRHDAALKFAEVAKAKSGGRIEVQVGGHASAAGTPARSSKCR